ncbi:MAG: hypothetical protein CMJ78_15895, partial [Planctomycetaceae bacterium]|nr:hypothetical protein [Planctomycetaceae bacterium]
MELIAAAGSHRRDGATLTEVLMSLMIMGIGVVALASLFPIAVIRSIEATKLTHATNLRLNAEAMVGVYPHVVDGGFTWLPALTYQIGQTVVPPDANGCVYKATNNGPSGTAPPAWPEFIGQTVVDNGVTWICVAGRNPTVTAVNQTSTYVIDPLGWAVQNGAAVQNAFGNSGGGPPAALVPASNQVARLNVGFQTAAAADTLVSLPDSWVIDDSTIDATLNIVSATQHDIVFPGSIDLNMLQNTVSTAGVGVRLVLISADGKQSQVRTITDATTINPAPAVYTVTLSSPLPNTPNFNSISEVRIETQQRRYSWLMTVRRPVAENSDPSVDLAVVFNRSLTDQDEIIYPAHFTSVNVPGLQQPNQVKVDWTVSGTVPFIKKGG